MEQIGHYHIIYMCNYIWMYSLVRICTVVLSADIEQEVTVSRMYLYTYKCWYLLLLWKVYFLKPILRKDTYLIKSTARIATRATTNRTATTTPTITATGAVVTDITQIVHLQFWINCGFVTHSILFHRNKIHDSSFWNRFTGASWVAQHWWSMRLSWLCRFCFERLYILSFWNLAGTLIFINIKKLKNCTLCAYWCVYSAQNAIDNMPYA